MKGREEQLGEARLPKTVALASSQPDKSPKGASSTFLQLSQGNPNRVVLAMLLFVCLCSTLSVCRYRDGTEEGLVVLSAH